MTTRDQTFQAQVMQILRDSGKPLSLDEMEHELPHIHRRQIRSALGTVIRDRSGFYRIGDAVYTYNERKLREHRDGRNGLCVACGHAVSEKETV